MATKLRPMNGENIFVVGKQIAHYSVYTILKAVTILVELILCNPRFKNRYVVIISGGGGGFNIIMFAGICTSLRKKAT